MRRYKTVDEYIDNAERGKDELRKLREIMQSTELEEVVKWGSPCYQVDGKLICGLGSFKSYVGIWFFQGALLADKEKVLINAQDGKTKAMRQWRFSSKKDIKVRLIKSYIKEAIELQRQGKEIKPQRGKPVEVPPQLDAALAKNKKAKASFERLTLGKKREYAEYISTAKREETKATRLEKILPMILEDKGLNDKYRNC